MEDIQELNNKIAENGLALSCDMVDLNPAQGILLLQMREKYFLLQRSCRCNTHFDRKGISGFLFPGSQRFDRNAG